MTASHHWGTLMNTFRPGPSMDGRDSLRTARLGPMPHACSHTAQPR